MNPLIVMWALTQLGKGGAKTAPSWPDRTHPPPQRLPDRAQVPAPHHHAPPHAHSHHPTHRPANTSHAPRTPDAAPPMPDAAAPRAPDAPIPVATSRSPARAASELLKYVQSAMQRRQGALLGTKGRPNTFIASAQRDMGMKPDGIYGPATRARGKAILHKEFPARVSGGDDRPLYIP